MDRETTLHGLERTAWLQDLLVMIGDVWPNDPVGAIAVAANEGRVLGLNRRVWYLEVSSLGSSMFYRLLCYLDCTSTI